jgi:hypothetical protein
MSPDMRILQRLAVALGPLEAMSCATRSPAHSTVRIPTDLWRAARQGLRLNWQRLDTPQAPAGVPASNTCEVGTGAVARNAVRSGEEATEGAAGSGEGAEASGAAGDGGDSSGDESCSSGASAALAADVAAAAAERAAEAAVGASDAAGAAQEAPEAAPGAAQAAAVRDVASADGRHAQAGAPSQAQAGGAAQAAAGDAPVRPVAAGPYGGGAGGAAEPVRVPSFQEAWSSGGAGPAAAQLLRKLRWATLGPQVSSLLEGFVVDEAGSVSAMSVSIVRFYAAVTPTALCRGGPSANRAGDAALLPHLPACPCMHSCPQFDWTARAYDYAAAHRRAPGGRVSPRLHTAIVCLQTATLLDCL